MSVRARSSTWRTPGSTSSEPARPAGRGRPSSRSRSRDRSLIRTRGAGGGLPAAPDAAARQPHNRAVDPRDVVSQLWRRIQARDWDAVGESLAEDFVLEWPNALVRIRGRANFVEFNRNYPEGWSIEVLRVVAEGQ